MSEEQLMDRKMSLVEHLTDLRRMLVVSILAILVASIGTFIYSDQILQFLTRPIQALGIKLIQIRPMEYFFVKLKVAIFSGIFIALPIVLWQIWSFVAPALYPKERRSLIYLVPVSFILFIGGVAFSYFTVYKIGMTFLVTLGTEVVEPQISVGEYLSFTISFLLPFGFVFELPLVILFLTRLGIVTPEALARKRKLALLVSFVVAAFLTPTPDVISQILMAGPMYLLFEGSIILARLVKRREKDRWAELEEEKSQDEDGGT